MSVSGRAELTCVLDTLHRVSGTLTSLPNSIQYVLETLNCMTHSIAVARTLVVARALLDLIGKELQFETFLK